MTQTRPDIPRVVLSLASPVPEVADTADESLLASFAKGDDAALAHLAARYESYLYGLALALLSRRDDLARDAVQESWLRVIRAAARFRADSSFKTWIYRILVNRCIDLRTKHKPTTPLADDEHAPTPTMANPDTRLAAAVAALPQGQQIVILLCYHRGLTHAQAAEVLALPPGTLKSRLNAALTALRTRLGPSDTARWENTP